MLPRIVAARQERHQQLDPAAILVRQPAEIKDYHTCTIVTRLLVGV